MTDAESNTPSEEHDPSIALEPDFDEYGLHDTDSSTVIIRIDHNKHFFERVALIDPRPSGVVLKEHTRLADESGNHTAEVYQPIRYIPFKMDEFGSLLREAVFDTIYEGKVDEGVAKELSAELAEDITR